MIYKLGYFAAWIILGPIIVVISIILCPFVLSAALILAAKNGFKKPSQKIINYGLTPPPKEVIILN